jgi:non-specific serine/threonine protein kinase
MLAHPNILTIFDIGEHRGGPFIVTELLTGETLSKHLKSGPLSEEEVVEFSRQIADGLSAAHALKVIHRDLKPDNVFVTQSGVLKILDFGLAKLKPSAEGKSIDATADLSSTDRLIGTPAYMAPEQLRGEPADERADIFALGLIVYEMLTGQHPFRRKSGSEMMAAILREDVPPPAHSDKLPGAFVDLLMSCLSKAAEDRPQSASDILMCLQPIQRELKLLESDRTPAVTRSDEPDSIAVLPFVDMSPTRDQGYLCEGIADEVLSALTHIEGLRVAARSSAFQFQAADVDIRAVGARLGVNTVLEDGVRKSGERLRITAQLVAVADGYQLWAKRFDGALDDVFEIQDEIAESVATALKGILSSAEKQALHRQETTSEAYEYYLRGRQLLLTYHSGRLEEILKLFKRTIELDPGYGPAYAGIAKVHCFNYEWWGQAKEDLEAADYYSSRALELAPESVESQTARGATQAMLGNYEEAARAYERAIEINPNDFDAYYLFARSRFAQGRIAESAKLFRRASEVRTEDYQTPILLAQSLLMLGEAEEATSANREGIRRAERFLDLDPTDARALSLGASALAADGQIEKALSWSNRARELYPEDLSVLINGTCVRAKAGLKEEAFEWLEIVASRGWGKRDWIENDPDYDSLRDDPRFEAFLRKLN